LLINNSEFLQPTKDDECFKNSDINSNNSSLNSDTPEEPTSVTTLTEPTVTNHNLNTSSSSQQTANGKVPISFTVLLNSALKADGTAAIVSIGNEWYGCISCSQDLKNEHKRKNNLILSIFYPGNH
jgi:hypothetical protein